MLFERVHQFKLLFDCTNNRDIVFSYAFGEKVNSLLFSVIKNKRADACIIFLINKINKNFSRNFFLIKLTNLCQANILKYMKPQITWFSVRGIGTKWIPDQYFTFVLILTFLCLWAETAEGSCLLYVWYFIFLLIFVFTN